MSDLEDSSAVWFVDKSLLFLIVDFCKTRIK